MKSVEDAYTCIAKGILWFVQENQWLNGKAEFSIWHSSTQTSYVRSTKDSVIRDDKFPSLELSLEISTALIFLRNDLLRSTGKRIWGGVFTLYPNGRFNIEYNYNKPEGYEETEETISGDEINASLNKISKKDGESKE